MCLLTFDVMSQNRSVVVLPPSDSQGCGGVGFSALISCNNFYLASISVLALGNVKMPHTIVDQLVTASLEMEDVLVWLLQKLLKLTLMTV